MRRSRAASSSSNAAIAARAGMRLDRLAARASSGSRDLSDQHVLRQARSTTGPGRPSIAVWKARETISGTRLASSISVGPFRHRAEEGAIVHLLERVAVAEGALDLADEQQHRRRIVSRDMHARRSVGRAGAARDEADARAPGRLAHRFGHHRRARLVAADGDRHIAVAQARRARQDSSRPARRRHARRR